LNLDTWQLKAYQIGSLRGTLLGSGSDDVLGGLLGKWKKVKPQTNYELLLVIKDKAGRTFTGRRLVP
jgi:hypothetical protein